MWSWTSRRNLFCAMASGGPCCREPRPAATRATGVPRALLRIRPECRGLSPSRPSGARDRFVGKDRLSDIPVARCAARNSAAGAPTLWFAAGGWLLRFTARGQREQFANGPRGITVFCAVRPSNALRERQKRRSRWRGHNCVRVGIRDQVPLLRSDKPTRETLPGKPPCELRALRDVGRDARAANGHLQTAGCGGGECASSYARFCSRTTRSSRRS